MEPTAEGTGVETAVLAAEGSMISVAEVESAVPPANVVASGVRGVTVPAAGIAAVSASRLRSPLEPLEPPVGNGDSSAGEDLPPAIDKTSAEEP